MLLILDEFSLGERFGGTLRVAETGEGREGGD